MPLTILHAIPSFVGGGAERQLVWLSAALVQAGVRVHIVHLHGGTNLEAAQRTGATLHGLPVSGNYDLSALTRTRAVIRDINADLVQTWLLHADVSGGLAARWAGVPWLLNERASASLYGKGAKFALRRILGQRADAIVANSQGGVDYWRATGYRGPTQVIRNIVPAPTVEAASIPQAREDALVIAIGRLAEQKNYLVLLQAFEIVLRRFPAARLDVLGEGHLRETLQARIDGSPALTGHVRLVGHVNDVPQRLRVASLFVSTSHFEGTPNAVLDAMRAGCPLALSDIPSHRELVDERSARFFDAQDASACAQALADCLLDREASHARALTARAQVADDDWSGPCIAAQYISLYEQVKQKARRSR